MTLQINVIVGRSVRDMKETVNAYCIEYGEFIKELHFPTEYACVIVLDVPDKPSV